jgi:hypothetical protein
VQRGKHEVSKHHEIEQKPGQMKRSQCNFEHQIRTAKIGKMGKKLHGPKKLSA